MKCKRLFQLLLLVLITLFSVSCSRNRNRFAHFEERGMFAQKIRIRTLPTRARIFINEQEIGESPLTYTVRHEDRRMVNIKAVPIYPNQYTQNIFLMVPPIPKTMTIYMNHYPENYDLPQDRPFTPPEKPLPQVVVRTERDTVYVDQTRVETNILSLPVILFDTASFSLNPSELTKLEQVLQILNTDPGFELEIYGFADHRASERYNLALTLNRANAVRDFLVSRGVATERLRTFGHGKVSRISTEGPDPDLQQNRKVLFLLKRTE